MAPSPQSSPCSWSSQPWSSDRGTHLNPPGAAAPEDATHRTFIDTFQAAYGDDPRNGSLLGNTTVLAVAAAMERSGNTESEALIEAFKGLTFASLVSEITFRSIDH